MLEILISIVASAVVGTSTSDYCEEPRLGPGGSTPKYCEAGEERVVATPFFRMVVPGGGWFAIDNNGRSGAMQPDLSVAALMLSIKVLTPEESLAVHSIYDGQCTYTSAGAERLCENEIDGTKTLERVLMGESYSVRIILVERWSGPLVQTYRSAVMNVDLSN